MKTKKFSPPSDSRTVWRRLALYAPTFFFLVILQCAFFSRLKPFGAVPDITLGALCAVLMLDNKKAAAVCAVAAGYFTDALGSHTPSFAPVFYLLCIVLVGALTDKMLPRFAPFCLCLVPAAALGSVYTVLCIFIGAGALPDALALFKTLAGGAFGTFLFSLPVYFLIKLCTLPLKELRG